MLDNISGYSAIANYMAEHAASKEFKSADEVKQEFARIFYKEILRQAYDSQNSILEEEERIFPSSLNNELMLDKLAETLARRNMKMFDAVANEKENN
ncbi:MAG: hypothetical protein KKH83_00760 [Candidatus Margulisbacteria bacterium]|nr:hypothetical protein [Candidatus Margulisiibacteriota bacterium]